MRRSLLSVGEPAPWFVARASNNPQFQFETVGGRYVVLSFFQSAAMESSRRILDELMKHRAKFDDQTFCFFGVSTDEDDERLARVEQQIPGIRFFWDFDRNVSRLFGATDAGDASDGAAETYRRFTLVLDERLRTLALFPFDDAAAHVSRLMAFLESLPPIPPPVLAAVQAPILVVPRVFEPELCSALIQYYDQHGGEESGFMRDVNGRTVSQMDYGHKRRRDQLINDEPLRSAAMFRIHDRLVPEIAKAFQFRATRIERHIVACYDSTSGGYFRPHRDNTTKGTAHRRFAVSLNLNTGQYEGGQLRFPEFGQQMYNSPAGGAVVFSCSLLHEALPVTSGRRYVYLPFLYDDEAAKIRAANQQFLASSTPEPSAS